jgi:hypothetical protein
MKMADRDKEGLSGRDLQSSQSGGESGEFGGNRAQQQANGMVGGGPSSSDLSSAGGSSGTGGYGNAQNALFGQGQGSAPTGGGASRGPTHQSRGERFDEEQGGGRSADSVSPEAGDEDDLLIEASEHQDRGQSEAEAESE